jgi:hypothetical protein
VTLPAPTGEQPPTRRKRRVRDETGPQLKPWTTPQLLEIQVTPEERAKLERSPGFVALGDVTLIPEEMVTDGGTSDRVF